MFDTKPIINKSDGGSAALPCKTTPEPQLDEPGTYSYLPVQLKLSVGAPDDPLEQEADAMADKVMRMPETSFVQRKPGCGGSCGDRDDEHVRLKPLAGQVMPFIQAKGDGAGTVSDAVSGRIKSSMGGGSPMQGDTKSFMESRFGTSFDSVKIHNNDESAQLNRSLNAKAFTVSDNIYFNSGNYQPETYSGKHLLAHELTHVVQQSSWSNNIQRQPAPPVSVPSVPNQFAVTGIGKEGNIKKVFFDRNDAKLDLDGQSKITLLSGPPTPMSGVIELKGFVSEDEPESIAQNRIDAVKAQFKLSKSFTGTFTETLMPSASTAGRLDYRQVRAVEIIEAGKKSTEPDCKTTSPHFSCPSATENNFQQAVKGAGNKIDTATTLLNASPRSAATNNLLDRFFGQGVAGRGASVLSTLLSNIAAIKAQISRINDAKHHQCANLCDGVCANKTIAYNQDVKEKAMYTICPTFDTLDEANRFRNMIHECAHGTSGIITVSKGARDFAYRHERMINLVEPSVALKNSDSYALMIMFLADPAFTTEGPASDDTTAVNKPAEKAEIGLPIANLEKWLKSAEQDTGSLYKDINEANNKPSKKAIEKTWNASPSTDTRDFWASNFPDLTKAPGVPNNGDQMIIAGIYDRVNTMARGVKRKLVFSHPSVKDTNWESDIGANVTIGDDFFAAKDPIDKALVLLKAIVHSNLQIPPGSEPGYVDSIDKIRKTH